MAFVMELIMNKYKIEPYFNMKISKNYHNFTLEKLLKEFHLANAKIKYLIDNGNCYVNGEVASSNTLLRTNDYLTIDISNFEHLDFQPEAIEINILYEDEYLLVINKPSGYIIYPDNRNATGTIANFIADYYDKNNLDLDLSSDKLNKDIKKYIEDNPGTSKNKYSMLFENKNLIFVVAESFSEIGVDEERTPTLYRLMHNGFTFDNFYVPYYLSTIGGEAQSLTGLYPNYATLTKWKSGENSFPYGLATVFKEKGYNTYAYHAHNGYFQNRYKYLKALGFDNFKACNIGLDINCNMWPESDIEMINASINDYIDSDKPFMTYYMTVSGHLDYTKDGNSIVSKNWDLVKDLDYSDKAKSYIATQIELDRAMEILIKGLEDKGILDDTVIVLLADHYPYGLTLDEINELSSYERDGNFEINHNALIIYNSSMKNVNITKTGMPIDVLPTIYNLFGIRYDSRLLAGNDLLSNSEGMVILDNLSWITDKGRYDSLNNKYYGDIDNTYVNNINNIICHIYWIYNIYGKKRK